MQATLRLAPADNGVLTFTMTNNSYVRADVNGALVQYGMMQVRQQSGALCHHW